MYAVSKSAPLRAVDDAIGRVQGRKVIRYDEPKWHFDGCGSPTPPRQWPGYDGSRGLLALIWDGLTKIGSRD